MFQGINRDGLIKDITKLEYQNNEIYKELKVFCTLKNDLESKYTTPTSQIDINNNLENKITDLKINRENEIELLKGKIILYDKTTNETEDIFRKVKTSVKIK